MFTALQRMFERRAQRAAARRYGRELGPRLRRDYGASDFYAPKQIQAAVAESRLPPAHIELGYAAFLPEETFRTLAPGGDYLVSRTLLLRYTSSTKWQTFEPSTNVVAAPPGFDHG